MDFNDDGSIDLKDAKFYVDALSVEDLAGEDDIITDEDRLMLLKLITEYKYDIYRDEVGRGDITGEQTYSVIDGMSLSKAGRRQPAFNKSVTILRLDLKTLISWKAT